jgi:uncharacterized protein (DUF1697 family)
MTHHVALLRAVNVGKRKVPMADLRALCSQHGLEDAKTYVASGNVVFAAKVSPAEVEDRLEAALEGRFGFKVDVVVRTARQIAAALEHNPFVTASAIEPHRVMLLFAKRPLAKDAAERIMERAQGGEKVVAVGDALWFHFPAGVAASKLAPAFIDKCVGSPGTSRNIRTVRTLAQMAGGLS